MCDEPESALPSAELDHSLTEAVAARTLQPQDAVERLVALPELRRPHVGFVGYGGAAEGQRVLIALDTHYEREVGELLAGALRDRGASVDVLTVDVGPDRRFTALDEMRVAIRDRPWAQAPRRWEGLPLVEDFAVAAGYDLLIHGKGGPTPKTSHRYEQVPWLRTEHLTQGAALFPRSLHELVNRKTWEKIWVHGRGGQVHLSDPEGTDLRFTLHESYFDGSRRGFLAEPVGSYGHLHGHPPQPILPEEDASGVIAGTTSHFSSPFPQLRLHLEGGRLQRVEGGGAYGEEWQRLHEVTQSNVYPCFPRPGLFWLWEVAIGTNPWIRRPSNVHLLSSGGFEWERRRSGVIHIGLGTRWRGPEEKWAGEQRLLYGHLHVHLLFPTYEIRTRNGETVHVVDRGRLTALDDPEVKAAAAQLGDPEVLLREQWVPQVPGISAPGSYETYAADPESFLYPVG